MTSVSPSKVATNYYTTFAETFGRSRNDLRRDPVKMNRLRGPEDFLTTTKRGPTRGSTIVECGSPRK